MLRNSAIGTLGNMGCCERCNQVKEELDGEYKPRIEVDTAFPQTN